MTFYSVAIAGALLAAAAPALAQPHAGHEANAPAAPVVKPIVRTATTISGQPLRLPQGAAEVVGASVDIPAGGSIAIHKHPWSRFVYVERGRLQVVNHSTGASQEFAAGTLLAEVIDQWHEGKALGADPVRLVVIDLVPPGVTNMVMRPAKP